MSEIRELAERLSLVAADAVVETVPNLHLRSWDLEQAIRGALLSKLYQIAEERRQQQRLQAMRARKKEGKR